MSLFNARGRWSAVGRTQTADGVRMPAYLPRLGAPRWLITRMLVNAFLDTTIGAVPVVGDAFDVLFRANMKNMTLLRRHLEKKGHRLGGTVIDDGSRLRDQQTERNKQSAYPMRNNETLQLAAKTI